MPTKQQHLNQSIEVILAAGSQEEVKSIIDKVVTDFAKKEDSVRALAEYVKNATGLLELQNPMEKTPQQWSNIKMARIHLNKLKRYPSAIAAAV